MVRPAQRGHSEGVAAGRVLGERYRLIRPLGEGGMGSVWEAEHVALGSAVAVKVIRGGGGPAARARFVREAKAAASLTSPHVVTILDYGVDGDTPYIAMERLAGETLAQRLRREGRLAPDEVVRIVGCIARAIGTAHAAGIVHRDLKPDNVMLVEDGAKVLDFGVAKAEGGGVDDTTQQGTMLGTPRYMSPEQAKDPRRADARSDLWSLGVIAYECVVGQRPFEAESLPTLSVKLLVDPIPVPSEHADDVPPGFDAWFARAAAREPEARFDSARELAEALAVALATAPPTASTREGAGRGAAPSRAPWIAAALAVAGVGIWWSYPQGEAQERTRTIPGRASGAAPLDRASTDEPPDGASDGARRTNTKDAPSVADATPVPPGSPAQAGAAPASVTPPDAAARAGAATAASAAGAGDAAPTSSAPRGAASAVPAEPEPAEPTARERPRPRPSPPSDPARPEPSVEDLEF